MTSPKINNNAYLYTKHADFIGSKSSAPINSTSAKYAPIKNNTDENAFVTFESETKKEKNNEVADLRKTLKETKEKQGFIGKLWDGFKNITKIGAGSSKAEKAITDFENGKISKEEMEKAVNGYTEGQKMVVDVVADVASGILAVGAFALAVPTGGASLAVGLGVATVVGSGVKVGIKAGDAKATGKEYTGKDLLYDTATGAINGLLAPVTNGIGNTVTKTIGTKFGLTVLKEGGEEVVEQGVKQGLKQGFKSMVLNQTTDVVGGTLGKRAIALGAGMAVDGALGGASDNMVRAGLNGENIFKAGVEGAIGGMIMAPVIGGGFRVAGKVGRALNNRIVTNKVLPDGLATKFKQGSVGDCALLSTIDGMLNNPNTAGKIKNSITKTLGGDYNVKIGNKVVKVAKSSLTDEMLSDTSGIKLFEAAYKQLNGSLDGGFAEVVAKEFGLNPVHIANDAITDELLDKLAKNQNDAVLSLGTLVDSDGTITNTNGSRHYFTIKNIDTDSKMVTLTSPTDTSQAIKLTYDEVKNMGISIDGGTTKTIDLPNSTRNGDELGFKGSNGTNTLSSRQISEDELGLIKEKLTARLGFEPDDGLIKQFDQGRFDGYAITEIDYIRTKNEAYIDVCKQNTIEIDGRKIPLSEEQKAIYDAKIKNYKGINPDYCEQVIMSDAMFIEALAVNYGLDTNGKTTQELFDTLSEEYLNGKDIFPIANFELKDNFIEAFFSRALVTDPLKSLGSKGDSPDKLVHEATKALAGRLGKDEKWLTHCGNSSKYKQLAALADTYKEELRIILKRKGMSDIDIESAIENSFENENHIIFRALQRDAYLDLDHVASIQSWENLTSNNSNNSARSFIEIMSEKILDMRAKKPVDETFINGTKLTCYGKNKFQTLVYSMQNWSTEANYIPQYGNIAG